MLKYRYGVGFESVARYLI